jgi:serine phosphatase RsbU (regulator of sigma subunit)
MGRQHGKRYRQWTEKVPAEKVGLPEAVKAVQGFEAGKFDQTEMFATAFLIRVSPDGREWSFSGAGHPAALCLRGDASVESLESTATALGLFEDTEFETRCVVLAPADRLVVYTDGLTEARSGSGDMYGLEQLTRVALEALAENAPGLRNRLLDDLERHTEHRGADDDVTLVVAHPVGDRS